jgi:hypothetical protein
MKKNMPANQQTSKPANQQKPSNLNRRMLAKKKELPALQRSLSRTFSG